MIGVYAVVLSGMSPRERWRPLLLAGATVVVGAGLSAVQLLPTAAIVGISDRSKLDYAGATISGLEEAEAAGALVFHGGTAARDGRVITNGGRILSVTATADTVGAARDRAYAAVELVSFEGVRYRRDIAAAAGG